MSKNPEWEPVFVCGMGRSGSSWIAQSLGQSPHLTSIKEAWLIEKLQDLVDWHQMLHDEWHACTPWKAKGVDHETFVAHLSDFYRKLLALASGGRRCVEKTPQWNVLFLRLLGELFPNAHFVVLCRGGRNYVASMEEKKRRSNTDFDFEKSCKRWARGMTLIRDLQSNRWLRNFRIIRYEDLLVRFDAIFSELCRFVDIPLFSPTTQPPNSSFANHSSVSDFNSRWHSWTEHQKNVFKQCAGAELARWNYVESANDW